LQVTGSTDPLQGRFCSGSPVIPHHAEKIHRDSANCVKQRPHSARVEMSAEIAKFAAAFDVPSYAGLVNVVLDQLGAIASIVRKTKPDGRPRPRTQPQQPL
jgi:hypothetical protein